MKVLIVDDESLALSRLKRLLEELGVDDITAFINPNDALDSITKNKYDIAFLDISMPEISGLELANKILELEPSTFIIFQTAFDEFAIEAYKIGGVDYILKPTTKDNINQALTKVKKYLPSQNNDNKKILGKRGNKIYLIELDDIYFIKADLDEVIVKIKEADVYVRKKIGELNELLKDKNFFRIHRSIIVNVDKIKSMQSIEQSKLEIFFNDIDSVVTSSKDGAKEFREYLERRSL
jgi:two-component system LytT family response regulator